MKLKDLLKVILYTIILFLIGTLFFFNNFIQPVGTVGTPTIFNFLSSMVFMSGWIIAAIIAGKKRNKNFLFAAMIYSIISIMLSETFFKLVIALGKSQITDFINNTLGIIGYLAYMLWSWPLQGLLWVEIFSEINILETMMIVEPVSFLIGYFILARYSFKNMINN